MGNLTHTVSGDIASFRSAARVPIESLKCYFLPVQESGGDPSPNNIRLINGHNQIKLYHSKKNLLSDTAIFLNNLSQNGNQYVNTDTDTSTGTTHTVALAFVGNGFAFARSTATINTTINDIKHLRVNVTAPYVKVSTGVQFEFTFDNKTFACQFDFKFPVAGYYMFSYELIGNDPSTIGGFVIQNLSLEQSYIVSEYEPYEGEIRSIVFPGIGKNLLDKTNYGFKAYDSIVFGGENSSYPDGTLILDSGTYTFSINTTMTAIAMTHADGRNGAMSTNTNKITFTCNSREAVRIVAVLNVQSQDHDMLQYNYQLEVGDTATTYEPFNNTVYGGYIDIAKGELVQEWKKVYLNDPTKWVEHATRAYRYDVEFDREATGSNSTGLLSNIATTDSTLDYSCRWTLVSTGLFAIKWTTNYIDPPSLETIKQMASNNEIYICYKMENPIIYQLTSIQLKTFLDQNHIWSNTNDITEVSYAVHDSTMIRSTKKQIIGNEPHIETVTGSVASFNTDMRAPIESAKVYFNPIQDEGYPSPTLLKPITGWTGININYNDENYNTSWQDITGIIYGGYVNIIKGELVKTWESVLLDDPDKWLYISQDRTDRLYYDQQFDAYFYKTDNQFYSLMSSYWTTEIGTSNYMRWRGSTDKRVAMMTGRSLEDVKQDASDGKIQIAYMLNTPIHYQLSPTQLKSLIGQNNIWSNANGDIEVKYWTH